MGDDLLVLAEGDRVPAEGIVLSYACGLGFSSAVLAETSMPGIIRKSDYFYSASQRKAALREDPSLN